ncbi:MAG: fatty acid desaturase [Actinomycetota bacterium]
MATTMIPAAELLGEFRPTGRLNADARPAPAWRAELRRIPNLRNAISVVSCWTQTLATVGVAVWANHPLVWIAAFLLMARAHAQFAALMHEAAHRLLFSNRKWNDFVGRWLLGYASFTPTDLYRRGHMAHHRDEFGPDEPDIPLYRGYPIERASLRRKLIRDATGRTGWKLFKGLLRGVRAEGTTGAQARRIVAVQLVLIATSIALGHPFVYWFLWFAPYMTVWRVINRLRSIAEHGGMQRSKDRRETTHTVRQSWAARFGLVPFHIGWHLAHHVDSGVPMKHLPRFHAELAAAGYVTDALEYPTYTALWRTLSSR